MPRWEKLKAIFLLGPRAVLHYGVHLAGAKSGHYKRSTPIQAFSVFPLLSSPPAANLHRDELGERRCAGLMAKYGRFGEVKDTPLNSCHWTDSQLPSGDADWKNLWLYSRFDWALDLAIAFQRTGNGRYADEFTQRVERWIVANPANQGENWRCGQEVSIRLVHFLVAIDIMGLDYNQALVEQFVAVHASRIKLTAHYAQAQENDHFVTESAGLYLAALVSGDTAMRDHARKDLERIVAHLFSEDGGYHMYSHVYHRFSLMILVAAEWGRRKYKDQPFSSQFYQRMQSSVRWLRSVMVDGRMPVWGANDGTCVMNVFQADYGDYGAALDLVAAFSSPDSMNTNLLNIDEAPVLRPQRECASMGMAVLEDGPLRVIASAPSYRLRPGQADALHLDIWWKGRNLFVDDGSFCYASNPLSQYFGSTQAHNTVQFDGLDQMPKVSQFLYGDWLRASAGFGRDGSWSGRYKNAKAHEHCRVLNIVSDKLEIVVDVKGFVHEAVLRFRYDGTDVTCDGNVVTANEFVLTIDGAENVSIVPGWVSRIYGEKEPIITIEATRSTAGKFATTIDFR